MNPHRFDPDALRTSTLSPVELATGLARGYDRSVVAPAGPVPGRTARQVLESIVLRALQRGPCVVSFSGGRDSSSVLALAVHVARREGLPLPVPVSLRFPRSADADETSWQEELVRHVGVEDWQKVELDHELDLIGPYAQRLLGVTGLVWPFNSHFHLPIADLAPGGSMLTGFGGDELMVDGGVWTKEMAVLAGHRRPHPRDVVRLLAAIGPRPARRRFLARRLSLSGNIPRSWLTSEGKDALDEMVLEDLLGESVHWGRSVRGWIATRYRTLVMGSLGKVAALNGAVAEHPLSDADFLVTLAAERGRRLFADRTEAVDYLVGDLLPASMVSRSTKAMFNDAFWNVHSRRFAAEWDGTGVDTSLVDVEVLRDIWSTDSTPDGRTQAAFQAAWLASRVS